MDNEQERTYQAVLQAFRDFEAMRTPKQNVFQVWSGLVHAGRALTFPTTGDEMLLMVTSGGTTTQTMYVRFGKSDDVPVKENLYGGYVYPNVIKLHYNSYRYTSINLPVRSDYITLISGGGVFDFIVIFYTRNMGVRS